MSMAATVEPERVIVSLRPSGRVLVGPAVLFVGVVGLVVWLTGVSQDAWITVLTLFAGAVFLVVGCVIPLLAWLTRRVTITSRKLIAQHGLRVRERREVLHSRGYEASVRQTALQRVFRSGDIHIHQSGSDEPLVLRDLVHPELVQAVLHDHVEQQAGAAQRLVAQHGAHATDATARFDPTMLDDTQAM